MRSLRPFGCPGGVVWAFVFAACTGDVVGPGPEAENRRSPESRPGPAQPGGMTPAPAAFGPPGSVEVTRPADGETPDDFFPGNARALTPARAWRLSWEQIDNAISDLVGEPVRPTLDEEFPQETESGHGWLHAARHLELPEAVSARIVRVAAKYGPTIAARAPFCKPDEAACVKDLVSILGKRIFRRPLSDEEAAAYRGIFEKGAPEHGADETRAVIAEAMLRSPAFLYRFEVGAADPSAKGPVKLTPHELASALSFILTNRPPDASLIAAADEGQLTTPEAIRAQARRLMDAVAFTDGLYSFVSQWLGFHGMRHLEKSEDGFPQWSAAVGEAMAEETRAFLDDIARREKGSFQQLLTADWSFPPAALSWVHGEATTGARRRDPNRLGILMQPSVMTAQATIVDTNPPIRGVALLERTGCYVPPPVPPGTSTDSPPADPTRTTRERFQAHQTDPVCAACHKLFDPIGLAFEHFDAVGRYRTTENGKPIDSRATLAAGVLGPDEYTFENAHDVARELARNPRVHACFVRKAFEYFYGRDALTTDHPLMRTAMRRFLESEHDVREVILALVGSEEYLLRARGQ